MMEAVNKLVDMQGGTITLLKMVRSSMNFLCLSMD